MRADLRRSLRRLRPQKRDGALPRRQDADLVFAASAERAGEPLLLDTTVYIDTLEVVTPVAVDTLLSSRTIRHISVVLGELAHNFGRLDPANPRTAAALKELHGTIEDIPGHRVETASPGVVLEAGILSGLLFRMRNPGKGGEAAALNDATIFLHALEKGYSVLTRNIADFDLFQQIVPSGRVIFYRHAEKGEGGPRA